MKYTIILIYKKKSCIRLYLSVSQIHYKQSSNSAETLVDRSMSLLKQQEEQLHQTTNNIS